MGRGLSRTSSGRCWNRCCRRVPGGTPVWPRRQLIDGIRFRIRTGGPWRGWPRRVRAVEPGLRPVPPTAAQRHLAPHPHPSPVRGQGEGREHMGPEHRLHGVPRASACGRGPQAGKSAEGTTWRHLHRAARARPRRWSARAATVPRLRHRRGRVRERPAPRMEGYSARYVSVEGAPDGLQVGRPLPSPAVVRWWWRAPCASSGGKECPDRAFTVNVSSPRGNLAGRTLQEKGNGPVVQGCGRGPHGSAGAAGDMHEGRPGHQRAIGADDIAGGEQRRPRLQRDRAGPGGRDGPAQHVPACAAWAQSQAEPATPRGIQASLQGDGCLFEDDPGPCFGRQRRQARNGCRERRRIVSTSRVNCGAVNGQRTRKGHGRIVENRWAAQGLLDPVRARWAHVLADGDGLRWPATACEAGRPAPAAPSARPADRAVRVGGTECGRLRSGPCDGLPSGRVGQQMRRFAGTSRSLGVGGKGAAEIAGQRASTGAEGTDGGKPSTAAPPAGNHRLPARRTAAGARSWVMRPADRAPAPRLPIPSTAAYATSPRSSVAWQSHPPPPRHPL